MQQPSEAAWPRPQLEEISPAGCEALNAVYRLPPAANLHLGGRALRLAAKWLPEEPPIPQPWTVALQADGQPGALILPETLLGLIFADLDPGLQLAALSQDVRPILAEHALSGAFEALEEALGARLSVQSVSRGRSETAAAQLSALAFLTDLQGAGQSWCALRLDQAHIQQLSIYWSKVAEASKPSIDLPLPVRLRWASVELTLAELHSLAPGDIILLDESCKQPGVAVAVIGEHLVVPVELLRTGYRLSGQPRAAAGTGFEWSLDRPPLQVSSPSDGTPRDIPLRLFMEFGKLELLRSEAARLKAGSVLGLARPLEEGLDIVAGGARIGRGERTTVGNAVGVRVTRMTK